MQKVNGLVFLSAVYVLFSCNTVSIANISNDAKYRGAKFSHHQPVRVLFNPVIIRSYPSKDSHFFDDFEEVDSTLVKQSYQTFRSKLLARNFRIVPDSVTDVLTLTVDTICLYEDFSMEEVTYLDKDNCRVSLGGYESYDLEVDVRGKMIENGKSRRMFYEYSGGVIHGAVC